MKKVYSARLIVALLLVLFAAPCLFAGFSGVVDTNFYYKFDNNSYGFNKNNASASVQIDLLGRTSVGGGSGAIKAEAKGILALWLDRPNSSFVGEGGNAIEFSGSDIKGRIYMDYAKIFGPGWEFNLLSVPGVPDYAKSSIDIVRNNIADFTNASTPRTYVRAPGVSFKYHENTVGFGVEGEGDKLNVTGYAESMRFLFDNGIMFRFAGFASSGSYNQNTDPSFGLSGKFGYFGNKFQAYLASDVDFVFAEDKPLDVNADVMMSTYFGFIGVDAYFATKANVPNQGTLKYLLSARGTIDLDSVWIPLRLSLTVKDILAKQEIIASAGTSAIENLLLEAHCGYTVATNGRDSASYEEKGRIDAASAGLSATYEDKSLLTATAGVDVTKTRGQKYVVSAYAEVSSEVLISGATMSIRYAADDLTHANSATTSNGDLGTLTVGCTVEF